MEQYVVYVIMSYEEGYFVNCGESGYSGELELTDDINEAKRYPTESIASAKAEWVKDKFHAKYTEMMAIRYEENRAIMEENVVYIIYDDGKDGYLVSSQGYDLLTFNEHLILTDDIYEAKTYPTESIASAKAEWMKKTAYYHLFYSETIRILNEENGAIAEGCPDYVIYVINKEGREGYYVCGRWSSMILTDDINEAKRFPTISIASAKEEWMKNDFQSHIVYTEIIEIQNEENGEVVGESYDSDEEESYDSDEEESYDSDAEESYDSDAEESYDSDAEESYDSDEDSPNWEPPF